MCMLVTLTNPFSRGTVHVASRDVNVLPDVDPRYMSHPLGLEILARHMQFLPTIAETKPLAGFVKEGGETIPKIMDVRVLEATKEHVRRNTVTFNYLYNTCAMILRELGGVVNRRLRVFGVKRLRVVDTNIFPMIPKGNIQSSVYAVAEKAADLIKED